jgi:hypothetical protein
MGLIQTVQLMMDRASMSKLSQDMATAGSQGGDALRTAMDVKMADLRHDLAAKIIDEKEFKQKAERVSTAFNREIIGKMDDLAAKGHGSSRAYAELGRQLELVGKTGGESASLLTQAWGKFKNFITGVGGAIAAAFSIRAIVGFTASSIRESENAARAWNLLAASVRNAGVDYDAIRPKITATLKAIGDKNVFDPDDLARGLSQLVDMTGKVALSQRALAVAAELARSKQIPLQQAVELVGRALETGNTRGLVPYFGKLKEGQYALAQMEAKLKDMAATMTPFERATGLLSIAWGDFKEALGGVWTELIVGTGALGDQGLKGALEKAAKWVIANKEELVKFARDGLAVAWEVAKKLYETLRDLTRDIPRWMDDNRPALTEMGRLIQSIATAVKHVGEGWGVANSSWKTGFTDFRIELLREIQAIETDLAKFALKASILFPGMLVGAAALKLKARETQDEIDKLLKYRKGLVAQEEGWHPPLLPGRIDTGAPLTPSQVRDEPFVATTEAAVAAAKTAYSDLSKHAQRVLRGEIPAAAEDGTDVMVGAAEAGTAALKDKTLAQLGVIALGHGKTADAARVEWNKALDAMRWDVDQWANKAKPAGDKIMDDIDKAFQRRVDTSKLDGALDGVIKHWREQVGSLNFMTAVDAQVKAWGDSVGKQQKADENARRIALELERDQQQKILDETVGMEADKVAARKAAFERIAAIDTELAALRVKLEADAGKEEAKSRENVERNKVQAERDGADAVADIHAGRVKTAKTADGEVGASGEATAKKWSDKWIEAMQLVGIALNGLKDLFGGFFGDILDGISRVTQGLSAVGGGLDALKALKGEEGKGVSGFLKKAAAVGGIISGGVAIAGAAVGFVKSLFPKNKDPGRLAGNEEAYQRALSGDSEALALLLYRSPTRLGGQGGWATTKAQEDAYAKYFDAAVRLAAAGDSYGIGLLADALPRLTNYGSPGTPGRAWAEKLIAYGRPILATVQQPATTPPSTAPVERDSTAKLPSGAASSAGAPTISQVLGRIIPERGGLTGLTGALTSALRGTTASPWGPGTVVAPVDNSQRTFSSIVNLYGVNDQMVPQKVVDAIKVQLAQDYQQQAALAGNVNLP